MATDVIMPALGMAQETGKVVRWLKAVGDPVEKSEPIAEIETDKVTVELEAPTGGELGAILVAEDEDVPVGQVIAVVVDPGETVDIGTTATSSEQSHDAEPLNGSGPQVEPAATAAAAPASMTGAPAARTGRASPKARRMAEQHGVDLAVVVGTGPNGQIVASDIEAASTAVAAPAATELARPAPVLPAAVESETVQLSGLWRAMAENTTRSWQQVPQFVLVRDADMTRFDQWLGQLRSSGEESTTVTDLLVKVAAEALHRHPEINVSWADGSMLRHPSANVGVAVASERGLVVPVIHGADAMTVSAITERRRTVVAAAREGRLRPDDISGGTFTISNLGMLGVDQFTAIVVAPQSAILAVGRTVDRAIVIDKEIVIRPTMSLSITFDHRVVDGALGAVFFQTLIRMIEEPMELVR